MSAGDGAGNTSSQVCSRSLGRSRQASCHVDRGAADLEMRFGELHALRALRIAGDGLSPAWPTESPHKRPIPL